jgi:hypothetical protein
MFLPALKETPPLLVRQTAGRWLGLRQKHKNKQNIHQLQGILAGIFLSLKLFFNHFCGRVLFDRAIQLTM